MNPNTTNSSAPKKLIVFLDCGDTIIDEGTEIRDDHDIVIQANVIPGADVMVKTLAERGYTLAIVADGNAQSFKNILTQNGLYDYFTTMVYSETVKASKPSPRMFKAAIGALDLSEQDCYRIVMVGNNLSRDVKGANQMGITSVFLSWTPRYPKLHADESEIPQYTISHPLELIELVEQLNDKLA
ncbi:MULTISPECIES: HAD family hydrolase [Paenibacillus]|uniref:HAD family hydrolase n=2 Tax=Paenibacillus TaxID=44249 RepID=A0ABU6DE84_9BACL|nr:MULTISPECIES: HAD family hydrolase [Paenibacillus]MBA2938437.1 HAD-IA family hydrolase [Paenibacillus sp. CGMCC 1.16610]MCY9658727.1 HAD family hydrolase [Paenibacillus anseongense]MEB4796048.1 HAD family hydrolase [Paenibacillus chondroitinus]MVQ37495.1 HAD-IA family hydrolase [Paenibacillus anseongense]